MVYKLVKYDAIINNCDSLTGGKVNKRRRNMFIFRNLQ
jgi:hypothetical protein